ncbi:LutC/YkgG family protein [Rhizobium pisi]
MSSRELILETIRKNRPAGQYDLPVVPDFTKPATLDELRAKFIEMLELMGGTYLPPDGSGDLLSPVHARLARVGLVCSAVPEVNGNVALDQLTMPSDLTGVDCGVVRAAFGVAETGSVLLTEDELKVNTIAYLPEHLIVLLDPADIVTGLQHAYKRPQFRNARYASFNTGPSATADVEGVLIHGAQGVRSLTVVLVPRT